LDDLKISLYWQRSRRISLGVSLLAMIQFDWQLIQCDIQYELKVSDVPGSSRASLRLSQWAAFSINATHSGPIDRHEVSALRCCRSNPENGQKLLIRGE
jgi:hypothetical protein